VKIFIIFFLLYAEGAVYPFSFHPALQAAKNIF